MFRVHFTAEDLVRTRFAQAPSPLMEANMALGALRRPTIRRDDQRRSLAIRRMFPPSARPLLDLIPPTRSTGPSFLHPLTPSLDEGMERVRATPRSAVRAELAELANRPLPSWLSGLTCGDAQSWQWIEQGLRGFIAACVAPQWAATMTTFQRDVTERTTTLAKHGYAAVFDALHPNTQWRDGALILNGTSRDWDVHLEGRGLLLIPSPSWTGKPLLGDPLDDDGPYVLVYAVARHYEAPHNDALATTLGRTRAAALRSLRKPAGTSELAYRLGISRASASEHASALRDSGLITTERRGKAVYHSLTRLGRSMLAGG